MARHTVEVDDAKVTLQETVDGYRVVETTKEPSFSIHGGYRFGSDERIDAIISKFESAAEASGILDSVEYVCTDGTGKQRGLAVKLNDWVLDDLSGKELSKRGLIIYSVESMSNFWIDVDGRAEERAEGYENFL